MATHCMSFTYEPKILGVINGSIRQTIRRRSGTDSTRFSKRKEFGVGDKLIMHGWEGRPYHTPWSWRIEEVLTGVGVLLLVDEGLFNIRGEFIPWDSEFADHLAQRDGIDPPTGFGLKEVLKMHGKDWEGEYYVLRW